MKISVYPNVLKPKEIHEYNVSFSQLYSFLSKNRPKVKKKQSVAWSPTTFAPRHRKAEYAVEMTCLVLDVDQKDCSLYHAVRKDPNSVEYKTGLYVDGTYDMILAELNRLQIRAIMHTSHSHTNDLNKFRIIFPLENEIIAQEEIWKPIYRAGCEWLHKLIRSGLTDSSTCDVSRAYYTSYSSDVFRADFIEGNYVDWISKGDRLREEERIAQEKRRAELENRNKLRLSHNQHIDRKKHVSFSDHRRYMYDLLKYDVGARQTLAERLHAHIVGNRAERWTCPSCLRNDATYFYIQPTTAHSLFCGHVKTCGDGNRPKWFSAGYIAEYYGHL